MGDQFIFWFSLLSGIIGTIAAVQQFIQNGFHSTLKVAAPVLFAVACLAAAFSTAPSRTQPIPQGEPSRQSPSLSPQSLVERPAAAPPLPNIETTVNAVENPIPERTHQASQEKPVEALPQKADPEPVVSKKESSKPTTRDAWIFGDPTKEVPTFKKTLEGFEITAPDGTCFVLDGKDFDAKGGGVPYAQGLYQHFQQQRGALYARYLQLAKSPKHAFPAGKKVGTNKQIIRVYYHGEEPPASPSPLPPSKVDLR